MASEMYYDKKMTVDLDGISYWGWWMGNDYYGRWTLWHRYDKDKDHFITITDPMMKLMLESKWREQNALEIQSHTQSDLQDVS